MARAITTLLNLQLGTRLPRHHAVHGKIANYTATLQTMRYVFDPTIDGAGLDRCWLFSPL